MLRLRGAELYSLIVLNEGSSEPRTDGLSSGSELFFDRDILEVGDRLFVDLDIIDTLDLSVVQNASKIQILIVSNVFGIDIREVAGRSENEIRFSRVATVARARFGARHR